MINPEKLLGGLVRQSLKSGRRSRRSRGGLGSLLGSNWKTAAGIGAIGVAVAAFEHFSQKSSTPSPPPGAGPTAAPPPPPPGQSAPPPLSKPPSSLPASGQVSEGVKASEALLLIRAMIAAANADGHIDDSEKGAILDQLAEAGATDEERQFLLTELNSPPSIDSLIPQVESEEMANQLYAVSLLAIEVDTEAEKSYLAYLRQRLNLKPETVNELHERFGVIDQDQ